MKTCEDCGSRVYNLGCVNCHEAAYILRQTEPDPDDVTCEHGTALDVHCCNCHSGFFVNDEDCVCELSESEGGQPTL